MAVASCGYEPIGAVRRPFESQTKNVSDLFDFLLAGPVRALMALLRLRSFCTFKLEFWFINLLLGH